MENNSCEEIWIVKHNLYEFGVASASPYEMKVRLEVCVYREENSLDTYLQSSLSCETVALIFVAITLIRQKHTDGAVSQTLRLRIKMSSLPTLDMQKKKSWQIFPHSHQFYFPFFSFLFLMETNMKRRQAVDENEGYLAVKQWYLGTICRSLNAVRQLQKPSVPGDWPGPRRRFPLSWKCFQLSGRSHFS